MPGDDSKHEAGAILNEYVQNEYKLSMWIPKDLAGKVIGKKGIVITNLQRETRAKQINALQPVGASLWIAVVILGGYKNIIAAYDAISNIVEDEVDGVVLEFMINYKKPFFLYGTKKFSTIKRVSAETNVRIFFPEFNPKEQPLSEALPVSLEGECVDVQSAVALLEEEAMHYKEAMFRKYGRNYEDYTPPKREPTYREHDNRVQSAPHSASKAQRIIDLVNPQDGNGKQSSRDRPREDRNDSRREDRREDRREREDRRDREPRPVQRLTKLSEEEEGEKIEKSIEIPSTLVGLLLSKKPKSRVTIMNTIQIYTSTVISKIINPDTLVTDADGQRRRRADSNDQSGEESEEEEDSKGDDQGKKAHHKIKHTFHNSENVFVTFKVLGSRELAVDMVIAHLKRIIAGDRIKEVMDDLRHAAKAELGYEPRQRGSYETALERGYHRDETGAHPIISSSNSQRDSRPDTRAGGDRPRYGNVEVPPGAIMSAVAPGDKVYDPSSKNNSHNRSGAVGERRSSAQTSGLSVTAPQQQFSSESAWRSDERSSEEPRKEYRPRNRDGHVTGSFVKHTPDGHIFGTAAPAKGGRGGGGGRADYAGGRGRDFGQVTGGDREERSGGRGRGRGGRGGRGGRREPRDSA